MDCDVAVIGLGAHGSAIAAHAAASGLSVCGIDRAAPPYPGASHHGESRIIRKAYYEDGAYVPLLERAYVLWDALACEAGMPLIRRTGGLMMGPADGELVPGALASAREHGLAAEWMDGPTIAKRFPAFNAAPGMEAVFEPEAGVLFPEACVRAHLAMAARHGATLRTGLAVERLEVGASRVAIACVDVDGTREVVRAAHCVVVAGAGLADLGLPLSRHVRIERQVVAHFAPARDAGTLTRLPIFAIEEADGRFYYGFPDLGSGVKVAEHHGGVSLARDAIDTVVGDGDIENLRRFLSRRLPAANGAIGASAVCRYTNLPDGHFAIDRREPRVTVVSACSGHGFKFAPVIGEVVALQLSDRHVPFSLSLFDPQRFDASARAAGPGALRR